jgi:quercetin dioxygenase-like cupin family protein
MSPLLRRLVFALLYSGLPLACASGPGSQDPVKISPELYRVALENEYVRVLDVHVKPGGTSPMHSHPALVIYSLSDAKVKFSFPDGKTVDAELKNGQAMWSEPVTHAADNLGTTEAHVLNFELKAAARESAPAGEDAAKAAPDVYKVVLENDRVRVLEVRLKPGAKVPLHSHPLHVIYPVADARAKFSSSDGKSQVVEMKAGHALWGGAETHASENVGTTEAHVLVLELKAVKK